MGGGGGEGSKDGELKKREVEIQRENKRETVKEHGTDRRRERELESEREF